jgi:hypothetical protein
MGCTNQMTVPAGPRTSERRRWKCVIATTCMALMCSALANPSQACEMGLTRRGLPAAGSVLVLGVVVAHTEAARPIDGIERAPSLLVRPEVVVSGPVAPGKVQVVPLYYGPDCRTAPMKSTDLDRLYPIGARIGIAPAVNTSVHDRSTGMIVVEMNRGGFVAVMPSDVKRTPEGDLDFRYFEDQHGYSPYSFTLGEFEFARAVVALRKAPPAERVARLLNLVHYETFRIGEGRDWLEQLIRQTRISRQERDSVLTAFDALSQGKR